MFGLRSSFIASFLHALALFLGVTVVACSHPSATGTSGDASSSGAEVESTETCDATLGLELYGLRDDSGMGAAGFKDGDRLFRVDGQDVKSPPDLIAVLSTANHLHHHRVTGIACRKGRLIRREIVLKQDSK